MLDVIQQRRVFRRTRVVQVEDVDFSLHESLYGGVVPFLREVGPLPSQLQLAGLVIEVLYAQENVLAEIHFLFLDPGFGHFFVGPGYQDSPFSLPPVQNRDADPHRDHLVVAAVVRTVRPVEGVGRSRQAERSEQVDVPPVGFGLADVARRFEHPFLDVLRERVVLQGQFDHFAVAQGRDTFGDERRNDGLQYDAFVDSEERTQLEHPGFERYLRVGQGGLRVQQGLFHLHQVDLRLAADTVLGFGDSVETFRIVQVLHRNVEVGLAGQQVEIVLDHRQRHFFPVADALPGSFPVFHRFDPLQPFDTVEAEQGLFERNGSRDRPVVGVVPVPVLAQPLEAAPYGDFSARPRDVLRDGNPGVDPVVIVFDVVPASVFVLPRIEGFGVVRNGSAQDDFRQQFRPVSPVGPVSGQVFAFGSFGLNRTLFSQPDGFGQFEPYRILRMDPGEAKAQNRDDDTVYPFHLFPNKCVCVFSGRIVCVAPFADFRLGEWIVRRENAADDPGCVILPAERLPAGLRTPVGRDTIRRTPRRSRGIRTSPRN